MQIIVKRLLIAAAALALAGAGWWARQRTREQVVRADVLVVGAGIGGLSAAWEAGHRGARVAVAEMSSVFGGNAVLSEGGLFMVDTPLQRSQGIEDSPALAERDMLAWGEDADPYWVRTYVGNSRREIYDWLTGLGGPLHGAAAAGRQSRASVPREWGARVGPAAAYLPRLPAQRAHRVSLEHAH